MRSNGSNEGSVRAEPTKMWTRRLAPSFSVLFFKMRVALGSRSTNVAVAAPRDRASSPKAPLPAKRSATRSSSNEPRRLASIENNVSRARSAVGRVASPGGTSIVRPRHWPAIILIGGFRESCPVRNARFRQRCQVPDRPVRTDHRQCGSVARPATRDGPIPCGLRGSCPR